MGNMKKLLENWRVYETEALNETGLLLPALALASGRHDVSTPAGREAAIEDAKKGYSSEMNYMVSPENREEFQFWLNSTADDDELFRRSQGAFGTGTDITRDDMEDMIRARWSDIVFDPSDPLDYASGALLSVPGAGWAAKGVVGVKKAKELRDKYKLFQTLHRHAKHAPAAAGVVQIPQAVEGGAALTGLAFDTITGADEVRAQASADRWKDQYGGTVDDPDWLKSQTDWLDSDDSEPVDLENLDEGEGRAIGAAADAARIARRAPDAAGSGGSAFRITKIRGLEDLDETTDAGRAARRQFDMRDLDARRAGMQRKQAAEDAGMTEEAAAQLAKDQYLIDRANLIDWTNSYHKRFLRDGRSQADEFFGLSGPAADRSARVPDFSTPGNSDLWRQAVPGGGESRMIDLLPSRLRNNPFTRNPKKTAAATGAAGYGAWTIANQIPADQETVDLDLDSDADASLGRDTDTDADTDVDTDTDSDASIPTSTSASPAPATSTAQPAQPTPAPAADAAAKARADALERMEARRAQRCANDPTHPVCNESQEYDLRAVILEEVMNFFNKSEA